jgi:hypothetical protein
LRLRVIESEDIVDDKEGVSVLHKMESLTETLRIRFVVNLHELAPRLRQTGRYEQFTRHHDNSTIPESIGLSIQRGNPMRNLLKRKTLYVSTDLPPQFSYREFLDDGFCSLELCAFKGEETVWTL